MARSDLRLVRESGVHESLPPKPTVALKLERIFPLLVHAHRYNYTWLKDMKDDDIVVTADLAEILASFEAILDQKRGA